MRVYETSRELAKVHNISIEKAQVAGLMHDYAKDLSDNEIRNLIKRYNITIDQVIECQINLAHGFVGAELLREECKIEDEEILDAIRYHTFGRENMSELDKLIYLADYLEPHRSFSGIDKLREMAFINLNQATLLTLENSIKYVIDSGNLIHINSILARNSLI